MTVYHHRCRRKKSTTDNATSNDLVNLLHVVDSPVNNTTVTVRRSNRNTSPSRLPNNVSPLSNFLFLYDPTRSSPLSNASELAKLSLSLMQSYLKNNEDNNKVGSKRGQFNLHITYHYYSSKPFRLFSMVCMKHHFFLISSQFSASDPNVPIFSDVHVYDSMKLVLRERSKKTNIFGQGSMAGIYYLTLQKFLSTFAFHNSPKNELLLKINNIYLKKLGTYNVLNKTMVTIVHYSP
jgi:hypothetical protein